MAKWVNSCPCEICEKQRQKEWDEKCLLAALLSAPIMLFVITMAVFFASTF